MHYEKVAHSRSFVTGTSGSDIINGHVEGQWQYN
jgi:hypothetical protein